MTTKRRRLARNRIADIDPTHWALLTDTPLPEDGNRFAVHSFGSVASGLWAEHRDRILVDWIARHPGTRPSCWWRFDAPELPPSWRGRDHHRNPIPANEQQEFLARHGLLLPGERA